MFKFNTYKSKFRLLIAGSIIFFLFAYIFAFSKTIKLWRSNKEIKTELSKIENAPIKIKTIEKELNELNEIIENQNTDGFEHHEKFLASISQYCTQHDIIIKKYPESHNFIKDRYTIETNTVALEGDFNWLFKLVYKLESGNSPKHIVSLKYDTKPYHKEEIYKLNLIIYEQNIIEN
jgi:hypothetical protein